MAYWIFEGEKKSKKKTAGAVVYKPKIYLDELNMYKRSRNKMAKNNYFKYHEHDMKKTSNTTVPKFLNNQLNY